MIKKLLLNTLKRLRNRMVAGLATKSDVALLYRQVEGLFQIQNALSNLPILTQMRGWAMSPDALAYILPEICKHETPTVVEFGSGQSTTILGSLVKRKGGRLISVEHDPSFMELVKRQCKDSGVNDFVHFVHAPLVNEAQDELGKSYDLSVLTSFPVDVVLVDGPPISNGLHVRLKPLAWAVEHLSKNGCVFLDDSDRAAEQACIKQLLLTHPRIVIKKVESEKGLVIIRHPSN